MVNWVCAATVVFGLGSLMKQKVLCYAIFLLLNLSGLAFVFAYVVETKGTDVENSPMYEGRRKPMLREADREVGGMNEMRHRGGQI